MSRSLLTRPRGQSGASKPFRRLSERGITWFVAALATLPVVAECIERITSRWMPIADDAMVAALAWDVPTRSSPVLGMPSTLRGFGKLGALHHPGPMLFWTFALPERLTGGAPAGVAAGVAMLHVAALLTAAMFARRRAGAPGAALVVAAMALVEVALTRGLLGAPVNIYAPLLAFGAFIVVAWSVAAGDHAALLPMIL